MRIKLTRADTFCIIYAKGGAKMFELDGFVAFDFNVGVPSASITPNGVTFNRSVVIKMNYPEHVVLMVNKETKQIAIKVCTAETQRAVTFYKQQAELP